MARKPPQTELEFPGADSFLDVVTNIVGILIILIVIIGAQAKRSPVEVPAEKTAAKEVSSQKNVADSIESDVHGLELQGAALERELENRRHEREVVATLIAAANRELGLRRGALDEVARVDYDQNRDLAIASADLEKIEKEIHRVSMTPGKVAKIESYPTPIAKTVNGRELHFQLKGKRLTFVPLDELVEKFKTVVPEKVYKLRESPEYTDTVGPIQGFYMRYTLERHDVSWENSVSTGHGGSTVQLRYCEFIPTTSQLGETIDEALGKISLFRAKLDMARPGSWTVTIWTYPDSFDEFRRLRKELYQLGIATACRPLPEGQPIAASPHGSKSAAE